MSDGSVNRVNVLSVALEERLDHAGFRHVATAVGPRLGAARIAAAVYDAEAGAPIWPYHYHHGLEEWLYVIAGAPVLREPAGERVLTPGDLVCFPSGPLGAHTVKGPGRFLMLSTGHDAGPWSSAHPDSDKVSGPDGIRLRGAAVDYWHGEGAAGLSEPVAAVREPEALPPRPVVNVSALPPPTTVLGPRLGGDRLDATIVDVAPGAGSDPYHYTYGREEWLLVLAGAPSLRHRGGERPLAVGDLVCLPEGPAGAHRLLNRAESPARVLRWSTTGVPANVCFPDTRRWVIHNTPGSSVELRETVALRPVEDADLDALFDQMRDPESVQMAAFTARDPDDRAAFDAHMAKVRAARDATTRAVTRDGQLVGSVACFVLEGDTEITYWIDRSVWGQGVASQALALLLDTIETRPLHARAASDNYGSLRILQRAGFAITGTEISYAPARDAEIEETILRLD